MLGTLLILVLFVAKESKPHILIKMTGPAEAIYVGHQDVDKKGQLYPVHSKTINGDRYKVLL
jgi:hypothetical protein